MSWVARSNPTKDFFIRMLTKDISLEDCILDLLDNAIDGARRILTLQEVSLDSEIEDQIFNQFKIEISFDKNSFQISDNCGGISLEDARDYAFHFGRRKDAPQNTNYSIGLYGIGMKRALFKIGNLIKIESRNSDQPFKMNVNVDEWSRIEGWDFSLEELPCNDSDSKGTSIKIEELLDSISDEFNARSFSNRLRGIIKRDYAFIIATGLKIVVNGENIPNYEYRFISGESFKPLKDSWVDEETGTQITLWAGMTSSPPDDSEEEKKRDGKELYGWHIICNGRTVLSADRSKLSIFGWEGVPIWHNQYNGFLGIVRLDNEKHPERLPWGTTKRQINLSNPLYRRVRSKMQTPTTEFIKYTNIRKRNLERSKTIESESRPIEANQIKANHQLVFPDFIEPEEEVKEEYTSIRFSMPLSQVDVVKDSLKFYFDEKKKLSNTKAGELLFKYYWESEVD